MYASFLGSTSWSLKFQQKHVHSVKHALKKDGVRGAEVSKGK